MTHRQDSVRCYHFGPEWTWEQWQWSGAPYSPKLRHYWNLTIRLFSVISRTLVVAGIYLSAEVQSVYSFAPADWVTSLCVCGESLTPLQRSSQSILLQQMGPSFCFWGFFLGGVAFILFICLFWEGALWQILSIISRHFQVQFCLFGHILLQHFSFFIYSLSVLSLGGKMMSNVIIFLVRRFIDLDLSFFFLSFSLLRHKESRMSIDIFYVFIFSKISIF